MYRCTKVNIQQQKKKTGRQDPCKFSHRTCSLPALENYEYCIKHILEDKTAAYKSCSYVYPINGKKCYQPTPKGDRKEGGFCAEHARKAQVMRQRAGGRHCPPQTVESLLSSLSHYAPSNLLTGIGSEMETDGDPCPRTINPFVEMDASKINLCGSRVLDYVSESDSDVEPAMLENVWRDNDRDSSDAESVDSQQEDPLKHAGIYTAEEVALIVKEKMCRLQTLYIDQFKRLQHVLKERKRKYFHSISKEKEAAIKNNMTTIYEQSRTSPKELKLYEKLKALNRFHKRSGEEGVLQMRVKEKRNQAKKMKKFRHKSRNLDNKNEGLTVNPAPTCKCIYTEGGVKCGLRTLPSSKYCRKHILEDAHQKLFKLCGCEKADVLCQEPVLNIFDRTSCPLHVSLPRLPHIHVNNEKKEEETDPGGGGDNVKTEMNIETESLSVSAVPDENSTPPTTSSTMGPGGDNNQIGGSSDCPPETVVPTPTTITNEEKLAASDSIMEDIMANVVTEEVVNNDKNSPTQLPDDSTSVENVVNNVDASANDSPCLQDSVKNISETVMQT